MDFFDGYVLPDGTRIPFPTEGICSDKTKVTEITIRNHPAYNKDAKQLVAVQPIKKNEWLGYYAGQVRYDMEEWNPYKLTPKKTVKYDIDASTVGNNMRYINDCKGVRIESEPNVEFCLVRDKLLAGYYITVVIANRDIKIGEEILASYRKDYWKDLEKWYNAQNPFVCEICNEYRTRTRDNLTMHISRNHRDKEFVCEFCEKTFTFNDSLVDHINDKHTHEILYSCNSVGCDFSTYCRSTFYGHNRIHKEKQYQCFECSEKFTNPFNLQRHVNTHKKLCPFKCDKCDYATNFDYDLSQHVLAKHSEQNPFTCIEPDCKGRTFSRSYSLKRHIETVHLKKYKFTCSEPDCEHQTADKQTMEDHVNTKHNGMSLEESRRLRKKIKV